MGRRMLADFMAFFLAVLIDEAWKKRGLPVFGDPGTYVVNMGRQVGTKGETFIRIIVVPNTGKIISAYPVIK